MPSRCDRILTASLRYISLFVYRYISIFNRLSIQSVAVESHVFRFGISRQISLRLGFKAQQARYG